MIQSGEVIFGSGTVYRSDGVRLAEVRYRLRSFQESISAGGEMLSSGRQVIGEIEGFSAFDQFFDESDAAGRPLTLHMDDGRRWDFVFGPNGFALGSGKGLHQPD